MGVPGSSPGWRTVRKESKMIFKSEKETNKNKTRITLVNLEVETFGTESQRNTTIQKIVEELQIKGFKVKLKSTKTVSVKDS